MEKRTALTLNGKIIAIFKSDESIFTEYVLANYVEIGLKYEDISNLEFHTIYIEI